MACQATGFKDRFDENTCDINRYSCQGEVSPKKKNTPEKKNQATFHHLRLMVWQYRLIRQSTPSRRGYRSQHGQEAPGHA